MVCSADQPRCPLLQALLSEALRSKDVAVLILQVHTYSARWRHNTQQNGQAQGQKERSEEEQRMR